MLIKIYIALVAIIIGTVISNAQPTNTITNLETEPVEESVAEQVTEPVQSTLQVSENTNNSPKLIVGIVVEDMRPDYLQRYWDKFRNDGFRLLIEEGHVCSNHHIDNLIQRPSVNMATLYTGTPPSLHGIVNDSWIDRLKGKVVNCTKDLHNITVGSDTDQGEQSSLQLLTSTIGDELKIFTNGKSKVFSVAQNAHSAIFSSGHSSDGAYWFDSQSGKMISSTYYVDVFPSWAFSFNSKRFADEYVDREWNTLYPISEYLESTEDGYLLEKGYWDTWNTFPYNLSKLYKRCENYQVLKTTPFGNTLIKDFSIALIANEDLGTDDNPDLLTIVLSSMDYERNSFGPASVEMQDTYLRMDQEIAHILGFLDYKFGTENIIVYLTSVTSASYPAPYLKEEFNMNVGIFNPESAIALLKSFLNIKYKNGDWVETYMNQQVYLNHDLISKNGIDLKEMQTEAAQFLNQFQGVAYVKPACEIESANLLGSTFEPFQNSYNPKRSGDILIRFEEGWQPKEKYRRIDYTENHQIPLVWFGGNIRKGKTSRRTNSKDVIPTIAEFLNIQPPNACSGKIIEEVILK